jgi:hypothetical protein
LADVGIARRATLLYQGTSLLKIVHLTKGVAEVFNDA